MRLCGRERGVALRTDPFGSDPADCRANEGQPCQTLRFTTDDTAANSLSAGDSLIASDRVTGTAWSPFPTSRSQPSRSRHLSSSSLLGVDAPDWILELPPSSYLLAISYPTVPKEIVQLHQ